MGTFAFATRRALLLVLSAFEAVLRLGICAFKTVGGSMRGLGYVARVVRALVVADGR
jgi:hypothetical protein